MNSESFKNSENNFRIPVNELFEDFKSHLDIQNNKRIFFSGRFGTGKTSFLKDFFQTYKNEYDCYHLFPVDYQISQNEDVIEFLKYDLIIELYKRDQNIFSNEEFDLILLGSFWIKENVGQITKTILSFIPKIGKPLKDTIDLVERFLNFNKEINEGEKGIIDNFKKNLKPKLVRENDIISELIKEKISALKKNKKSVLIVDDLDRIDPEHIFRILNVFSAHFDESNKELDNKFGFDKVIIVADYYNLESIFHHKYGLETDFTGYINKFYSKEIYFFNIYSLLKKYLVSHLNIDNLKITRQNVSLEGGKEAIFSFLLDFFINVFKVYKKVNFNLWHLLKLNRFEYNLEINRISIFNIYELAKRNLLIIAYLIEFLIKTLDNLETNLIEILKQITNLNEKDIEIKTSLAYNVIDYELIDYLGIIPNFTNDSHNWKDYRIEKQGVDIKVFKENIKEQKKVAYLLFNELLIEFILRVYQKAP